MNAGMPKPALQHFYVTRPVLEASVWVDALRAAGWPAQALPLIDITSPSDEATRLALDRMREHAHEFDALMFVSGAAVTHFFDGLAPRTWRKDTRFWAPGPATARRLREALRVQGVSADQIDAPPNDAPNFDSEALWPVVQPWVRPGTRVLLVRGAGEQADQAASGGLPGAGRDWLMAQCRAAGAVVQGCVAYQRLPPAWTQASLARVRQAAASGHVWLFSSSQALDHLAAMPAPPDWRHGSAVVTHPRIAERARSLGFGQVVIVRPTVEDVLAALESGWSHT